MTPSERTALLIGACEWGDLEALERLLELGERVAAAVLFLAVVVGVILLLLLLLSSPLMSLMPLLLVARRASASTLGDPDCCIRWSCSTRLSSLASKCAGCGHCGCQRRM